MENKVSLVKCDRVYITKNIFVRIPTVGEILEDEESYYHAVSFFTATPFQYMVQLDDMGLDYTKITEYELFLMLFPTYAKSDLSIFFGELYTEDYTVCYNSSNDTNVLYSQKNGEDFIIDELVYTNFSNAIRKIHNIEKVKSKPGNEEAKQYLLKKERKKQKRNANKPYSPYLERLVIALVNRPEFKYDYNSVMDLSIYSFMQSFEQIQTGITFENTMTGIYSGNIDVSKLKDKSSLNWILTQK